MRVVVSIGLVLNQANQNNRSGRQHEQRDQDSASGPESDEPWRASAEFAIVVSRVHAPSIPPPSSGCNSDALRGRPAARGLTSSSTLPSPLRPAATRASCGAFLAS